MDSPDTGSSPKSSSGRDDDYDSRAATADFITAHHPPQPLFDPFSHYTQSLHTFTTNPNPNPPWPGFGSGSNSLRTASNLDPHTLINPFTPSFQQQSQPATDQNNPNTSGSVPTAVPVPAGTAVRNPRKRSRASRRAPTTVLTTDTTNFRAMVQEFTGIPAPPFSHPSFPRPNRLDSLFGPARGGPMESSSVGPNFFRQTFSAQRPQPPPPVQFLVSNPMINYHQPPPPPPTFSSHDINTTNNSNNQNQFFSSLLQSNPSKFTFSGETASKPHNRAGLGINIGPGPEEFGLGGLGSTALGDLPNLISSDQGPARIDREDDEAGPNGNAAKWRRSNNDNDSEEEADVDRLKPANGGGYDYLGSTSSRFEVEKDQSGSGPENQGMVESWINSSE